MVPEKNVPGCANRDCFTGICSVMFETHNVHVPTLAKKTLVDPPGAIEGPPPTQIPGLVCSESNNSELLSACSDFVPRTEGDNMKDENI